MKNIDELLRDCGIEIPADKAEAFKKEFNANYKTVAEVEKKAEAYKMLEEKFNTTSEALKKFEGVNPEGLTAEIAKLQAQLKDADEKYKKDIHDREFNSAIDAELAKVKFSNSYAKDAVRAKLLSGGVQYQEGKLYGFADRMAELKESDPDAFASETEEKKVKFTGKMGAGVGAESISLDDYYKLKTSEERQKFIREHSELFQK